MSWQNRVMKSLVLGVLALMAISAAALADTMYVNGTCGDDGWTGASEVCAAPDGPKKTIQAGIDAASNDSEVVLADWVYSGLGNTQLDLRMKDIVVRSANGPEACVIDGEFMNRALIVWNQGPLDQDIEGITFRQCHHDSVAGAIYVGSSAIAFKNCVFTENSAEVGGAIQIRAGAKVYFENCFFSENASLVGGGGAVFSAAGAPTEFKPILEYWDSIPWVQFVSCHFDGNDGGLAAGAILVPANVRLTNCVFSHNVTSFIASAVEVVGENATVFGCVFSQNKCETDGALYCYGNSVVTNCTFGMNNGSAIYLSYESLPLLLKNCIIWSNSPAQLTGWVPGYQVTYSNVQGGWPGDGNIDADPVYVQPGSGDLTLGTASPCLDAGLTEALPLDLSDFDDDGD